MCCVMPPASVSHDRGLTDLVEERRLTVIDVAHNRHDRRSRLKILIDVVVDLRLKLFFVGVLDLDFALELSTDELDRLVCERLGDLHHFAYAHHVFHDVRDRNSDRCRDVSDRGARVDLCRAFGLRGCLLLLWRLLYLRGTAVPLAPLRTGSCRLRVDDDPALPAPTLGNPAVEPVADDQPWWELRPPPGRSQTA